MKKTLRPLENLRKGCKLNKRKGANERGYTYRWQKARLTFLAREPLCVMCKAKGQTTAAILIDHIIPHKGDMKLFWDTSNWQALCKPCHDIDKSAIERGLKTYGADGWPINQ